MRKKEKMQIKTNRLQKIFFVYLSFIIILSIFAIIYAILIYSGKMNSETKSFHIVTFFMGILSFLILPFLYPMYTQLSESPEQRSQISN